MIDAGYYSDELQLDDTPSLPPVSVATPRVSRPRPPKCEHGIQKRNCTRCGNGRKRISPRCEHGNQRQYCVRCGYIRPPRKQTSKRGRVYPKCEHGHNKYKCRKCGFRPKTCEHGRPPSLCAACGGSGVCTHDKVRRFCRICGSRYLCKHHLKCTQCTECFCEEHRLKRELCRPCRAAQKENDRAEWRQSALDALAPALPIEAVLNFESFEGF